MGLWKVLSDDGPLFHLCGNRVYGDEPQGTHPAYPFVWVDPVASRCDMGPGDVISFIMVIKARATGLTQAHDIMGSILGALADARPIEYLQDEGYMLRSGVGATGLVTERGTCVTVEAVLNVGPVGKAH